MKEKLKFWVILSYLILILGLTISSTGCAYYPEYRFDGKIGDEYIKTEEPWYLGLGGMTLTVTKLDGSKIIYRADARSKGGFVLTDVIIITSSGDKTIYNSASFNPLVEDVIKRAQEQFNLYLKKIMEVKTAPLFNQERAAPCSSFHFANFQRKLYSKKVYGKY